MRVYSPLIPTAGPELMFTLGCHYRKLNARNSLGFSKLYTIVRSEYLSMCADYRPGARPVSRRKVHHESSAASLIALILPRPMFQRGLVAKYWFLGHRGHALTVQFIK